MPSPPRPTSAALRAVQRRNSPLRPYTSSSSIGISATVTSRSGIPGLTAALPAAIRAATREAAEDYKDAVDECFATGGFGTWEKLNDDTIERKGIPDPLTATEQLRESITIYEGGASGGSAKLNLADIEFAIGPNEKPHSGDPGLTNADLGLIHEFGAPLAKNHTPERSFLRLTADVRGPRIQADLDLRITAIAAALSAKAFASAPTIVLSRGIPVETPRAPRLNQRVRLSQRTHDTIMRRRARDALEDDGGED